MDFTVLDKGNINDLKRLAGQVGWNFTDDQIALFMTAGTVYGLFSKPADKQELIAASAIYPYGTSLASLGIVMVRPDQQRRGVGTTIVRHCLARLREETVVSLIATPAGQPVYEALGFQIVEHVHRYELEFPIVPQAAQSASLVSSLQPEVLPNLVALDAAACGGNRRATYQGLFKMDPSGVVARDEAGALQGFAIAVRGAGRLLVGPVVADGVDTALQLVQVLVEQLQTSELDAHDAQLKQVVIRLDVPSRQVAFARGLQQFGFQATRVSPLMTKGGRELPGQRERLFALVDPALG